MKTLQEVKQDFFATLAELESGTVDKKSALYNYLVIKLEILHSVIADEIDANYEEYWTVIGKYICI